MAKQPRVSFKTWPFNKIHDIILQEKNTCLFDVSKVIGVTRPTLERYLNQFNIVGEKLSFEILKEKTPAQMLGIFGNAYLEPWVPKNINLTERLFIDIHKVINTNRSIEKAASSLSVEQRTLSRYLHKFTLYGAPLTFESLKKEPIGSKKIIPPPLGWEKHLKRCQHKAKKVETPTSTSASPLVSVVKPEKKSKKLNRTAFFYPKAPNVTPNVLLNTDQEADETSLDFSCIDRLITDQDLESLLSGFINSAPLPTYTPPKTKTETPTESYAKPNLFFTSPHATPLIELDTESLSEYLASLA